MNRPADWKARQSACDLQHSYIVQAPAGSGKTELLTQRLLGLLAQVENPEEVVAITFTRKAAAEMSHRVVRHLQAADCGVDDYDDLQPHQKVSRDLALAALDNNTKRGWNLLEQPSRLRVRTIDSLCSELARQLPVLSGLGGGQQIAVDANALYRKAAIRTMAAIEDDKDPLQADVRRVLDRYDNQYDRLVELLTGMLASREQWLEHLLASRQGDGFNRQDLEHSLRILIEIQLQAARQITPDHLLSELPHFYQYALSNGAENEAALNGLLDACGGLNCTFLGLPTTAEALPHWKTMVSSLLTSTGEMRKSAPTTKGGFPAPSGAKGEEKQVRQSFVDDFKALLLKCGDDDRLKAIYNLIRTLPDPAYEDEAWESLESLMRILLRATGNWHLVMAETGEVDFGEIASRAIQSLGFEGAPSDLALRMDYRIQHILVDEFQDTSASQIQLLNQLTTGWSDGDGRTLFLVGDPMQSIYRFRKAEVSLFIKAWQRQLFEHIQLRPLSLTVNFRSSSPVVNWVNETFPLVMPEQNDSVMGAVSYSKASTKPGVESNGEIGVRILPERDDEEEARQVVETIGRCDPDDKIAILVRSRTHASAILAELDSLKAEKARFRYQPIDFTHLADTTVIQDLVSLTLALIQPADRLAWLATLRAPYIGLDLADLDTLVAGNSGNIILDGINSVSDGEGQIALSDNGRQRLMRAGPVLLKAACRRGRQSVRSVVETAWISLGGPACVENDSELDDAATYFNLLDTLEQQNLPIDRDTLELRMKDLYAEPDADADEKLQVLTIYAAKGLEFDTVILPGLNREPSGDSNKLLHWFELAGPDRIVMSPMRNNAEKEKQKKSGLIKFISHVEKERQALENGRLLYVAATRAIHSLHMFAAIKPNAQGIIKANASSLMAGLWPAIEEEQTPLIEEAADKLQAAGEQAPVTTLPRIYRRLAPDWQLPTPPASVELSKTEQAETADYIEFSWAGEDARHAGNLVHRLLQLISEQGPENWEADGGLPKRLNWCYQQLAREGVINEKAEGIIAHVSRAIENCLASEQGRWVLGSHEDAASELAITTVQDGGDTGSGSKQLRNMKLDRTFIENGTRWIIDYKTSSHGGGNLEGFLENEAKRYRGQLNRYRDAMALTETRPIKTALYFPLFDSLKELD